MKTTDIIKNEIDSLMKTTIKLQRYGGNSSKIKKNRKRLTYLRFILNYILSTNLTDELIDSYLAYLNHKINIYDTRYDEWLKGNLKTIPGKKIKNPRKYYDEINGIPQIKETISILSFIRS